MDRSHKGGPDSASLPRPESTDSDEHYSLSHVSKESAKKGRISDLYDDIQEERLFISCSRDGRSVEYALEDSPSDDRS